jgi:hypothetical protein
MFIKKRLLLSYESRSELFLVTKAAKDLSFLRFSVKIHLDIRGGK